MGVPTARTDLSAVAASNSPAGSDTVASGTGPDDYLRAHASLIRANYDDILLKAPLANPTLTGTPAAPTAAADTNTTQIATTAFVIAQGYLKAASTNIPVTGLKSLSFYQEMNGGTGATITPNFTNAQIQYVTLPAGGGTIQLDTTSFPGTGIYYLRVIQQSPPGAVTWTGSAYASTRWLNDADANDINANANGESLVTIYYNGGAAFMRADKIGAV